MLDNIKGTWSQTLKFLGNDATLEAEYDRNANEKFLDSATISGKLDDVNYEVTRACAKGSGCDRASVPLGARMLILDALLTLSANMPREPPRAPRIRLTSRDRHMPTPPLWLPGRDGRQLKTKFGGEMALTVSADTADGTTVEAVATKNDGITKVTASRSTKIQGRDVDVEASHAVKSGESKLKLSSVLGHGVTAIVNLGPKQDADYELEYESSIGDGRKLSANVNPKDGSGEIEFVDSKSIDATVTASMPLGGKPKINIKRAWNF